MITPANKEKAEKLLLYLAELVLEKNNQEKGNPNSSLGHKPLLHLSADQIEARENALIRQIAELKGIGLKAPNEVVSELRIDEKHPKEIVISKASKDTLHSVRKIFGNIPLGIEIAVESYLFFKEMCWWEARGLFTRNELEVFWEYYSSETKSISAEHFSFAGNRQGLINALIFTAAKRPYLFNMFKVKKEKLIKKVQKISNANIHLVIEEMILSIHRVNNRTKERFMQIFASEK